MVTLDFWAEGQDYGEAPPPPPPKKDLVLFVQPNGAALLTEVSSDETSKLKGSKTYQSQSSNSKDE